MHYALNIIPAEPSAAAASLYLEANRLIRATGRFPDEVYSRYRRGIHRHLPIICFETFNDSLFTLATAPPADFSVLLVSLCLITYHPEEPAPDSSTSTITRRANLDRTTLHLAARSLFAQVQLVSSQPSVHLIQAGLLLAVYEYARGQPDDAFASITGCARMAYAAGIWRGVSPPLATPETLPGGSAASSYLQAEEAANAWWGLIICER